MENVKVPFISSSFFVQFFCIPPLFFGFFSSFQLFGFVRAEKFTGFHYVARLVIYSQFSFVAWFRSSHSIRINAIACAFGMPLSIMISECEWKKNMFTRVSKKLSSALAFRHIRQTLGLHSVCAKHKTAHQIYTSSAWNNFERTKRERKKCGDLIELTFTNCAREH